VLLVSHTLQELLQVADSLLLFDHGQTVAAGALNDVLMKLHLLGYAGDFAGTVLETRVIEHEPHYQLTAVQFRGQRLYVPHRDVAPGDALRVFVLARNVSLALQPVTSAFSVLNVLEATVVDVRTAQSGDAAADVQLDVGAPLLASITRKSADQLQLQPGQRVYAYIKAVSLEQEL
jgi:molybdate transport system ATP-binding protein